MDPRTGAELIRLVDERFAQLMKQLAKTAYGIVTAVDTVNHKATVQVSGETTASGGFTFAAREPVVGELVRVVIDPRGDRYLDEPLDATSAKFDRLKVGADAVPVYSSGANSLRVDNKISLGTGVASVETIGMTFGADVDLGRYAAGRLRLSSSTLAVLQVGDSGTGVEVVGDSRVIFNERTDPSAPGANGATLYARDNGAGKTQLCVRFNTGAAVVLATQP